MVGLLEDAPWGPSGGLGGGGGEVDALSAPADDAPPPPALSLCGRPSPLPPFGLPSSGPRCVGLGLVRSLDLESGHLYLLTPMAPNELSRCTAVARAPAASNHGATGVPIAVVYHGSASGFPYLFCEALTGTSAGMMKSRNNIQRPSHEK
jgi:hypothetical protein